MIAERKIRGGKGFMAVYEAEKGDLALVWFHGGGLEGGKPRDNAHLAPALTAAGVTLILPGYRFLQDEPWPACVLDAADAVATAARRFPDKKIVVGGSSAGAYLSMMLCLDGQYLGKHGMKPDDVAGWIFDAGQPTVHFNVLKHRGEDSRLCRLDETAPLYHVAGPGPDAPILILCADHDMACRVQQNRLMVETLEHFGRRKEATEMYVLEGYGHCGYDAPTEDKPVPELQTYMLDWLKRKFNI